MSQIHSGKGWIDENEWFDWYISDFGMWFPRICNASSTALTDSSASISDSACNSGRAGVREGSSSGRTPVLEG